MYLFVRCILEISIMSMSFFLMKYDISAQFLLFAFQKQIIWKLIFKIEGFAAHGFVTSTVLALCFAWFHNICHILSECGQILS